MCIRNQNFCGEACAASWLRRLGHDVDQDFVFDAAALDPAAARGCYTNELAAALRSIGFDIGRVWNSVAVEAATQQIKQQWQQLHADLQAGYPTIICTRYDARPDTTEHFRLIVGYDAGTDEVLYHEPAEVDGGSLQEHDLLETYYHRFVANHADDPSGYKTLQAVLQRDDMQAFQKDWEQYVMELEYR